MAEFQKWLSKFESEQVMVVAGSTDSTEKAGETVDKLGLTFPMAYGLNAVEISKTLGAYYDKDKNFLHPTGFLLRPNNSIDVVCYSSGQVGRFTARDLFGLVRFYKKQKKDALKTLN